MRSSLIFGFYLFANLVLLEPTIASENNMIKREKSMAHQNHENEHSHNHDEGKEEEHDHEEEDAVRSKENGITAIKEGMGFQLSPEAKKNFAITFYPLKGKGPWDIPNAALVFMQEEVSLFRNREGFFQRVHFQVAHKSETIWRVTSDELMPGDQIVLTGLGFLRIAELAATGGIAHGHSH